MAHEIVMNHKINGSSFSLDTSELNVRSLNQSIAEDSLRHWAELDEASRGVYLSVARKAMLFMHHAVEGWLPSALVPGDSGDRLVFQHEILFTDIALMVNITNEILEAEVAAMKADLIEDIGEDGTRLSLVKRKIDAGMDISADEAKLLIDELTSG